MVLNNNLTVQPPIRIWGLSDFHLSFGSMPAEMAFISPSNEPPWLKNARKISQAWSETVKRNDIVVLPGDISAAKSHASVQRDLAWLSKRAGAAHVLSPGNHDHWFGRMSGVQRILRPNQFAIDGNAIDLGRVIIAGARSQPTPDDPTNIQLEIDSKAKQSIEKLKRSLDQAKALQPTDGPPKPILVLWHHPPFDRWGRPDNVVELMSQAGVSVCVFGHIHTQAQWQSVPQGTIQGIKFACVAADSAGFRPRLIWEIPSTV
ncbi:MAG: metallophosphoesterase [Planctomycetota bacterium]|nr:MAG: metallophosphoesterase [Planctomycetota bacterium]